jgi:hypothetical protein
MSHDSTRSLPLICDLGNIYNHKLRFDPIRAIRNEGDPIRDDPIRCSAIYGWFKKV